MKNFVIMSPSSFVFYILYISRNVQNPLSLVGQYTKAHRHIKADDTKHDTPENKKHETRLFKASFVNSMGGGEGS